MVQLAIFNKVSKLQGIFETFFYKDRTDTNETQTISLSRLVVTPSQKNIAIISYVHRIKYLLHRSALHLEDL